MNNGNSRPDLASLDALVRSSSPETAVSAGLSHVEPEEAYELLMPFGDDADDLVKSAGVLLIRLHGVLSGIDQAIDVAESIESLRAAPARKLLQAGKEKIGQWIALETAMGLAEEGEGEMPVEMREDAEMR